MKRSIEAVAEWRGLANALAALFVRDLGLKGVVDGDRAIARLLDHSLFEGLGDKPFFDALFADARDRYGNLRPLQRAAHASAACMLARRLGWERWDTFLPLIFESARWAESTDLLRSWAHIGLGEQPSGDTLRQAHCHEALGSALYVERRFADALPEYEQAIQLAHAAGNKELEWDAMVSVIACNQFIGDHLTALDWTDPAEVIALELNNNHHLAKTLTDRGNSYLNLADFDAAEIAYRGALAAAQRGGDRMWEANVLGNLGGILHYRQDFRAAAEYHRAALAISKEIRVKESEQQDRANLAFALFEMGNHDEAISQNGQAIQLADERGDQTSLQKYRDRLRSWYMTLGNIAAAKALDAIDEPLEKPEKTEPKLEEHEAPRANRDIDESNVDIDAELVAALRKEDAGRAEKRARALVDASPNDWRAHHQLGFVFASTRRDREAIPAYDAALALNPRAGVTVVNQINAWARLNDLGAALTRYQTAVRDHPLDALPRFALGRVFSFAGDHDSALRELREALRLAPESSMALLALAQTLVSSGRARIREDFHAAWADFEEAAARFQQLMAANPDRAEFHNYSAIGFYEMANASHAARPMFVLTTEELVLLGGAAVFFSRALEINSDLPFAEENRERAVRQAFTMGQAPELVQAARILRSGGQRHMGMMFLMVAMKMDERSGEALYELGIAQLEDKPGDPAAKESAIEWLAGACKREPKNRKFAEAMDALRKPTPDAVTEFWKSVNKDRS